MDAPDDSSDRWLVACLCADWCHVCQDYRQAFDQLGREFGGAAEFVWVDIEDDEHALGAVEVDDFPTLLIARAGQICHFAAVVPNVSTGQRLVRRALAGELAPVGDASLAGLAQRLRARHCASD
jgi:thiol-disulfide isomerase/thioredoxin